MLTHVDLFSGIGGFSLAAEWAGFKTVVFCEKDEYCQKVLKKHWPSVPVVSEIREFKWPLADTPESRWRKNQQKNDGGQSDLIGRNSITLLTGGFPCQPFSCAGKQRGKDDDRFLWPEMFRVISEVRSAWVLAENVAGIVKMALDDCLSDLESEGYETESFIIPACAVNAPHRRDRVWIVAYNECVGREARTREGIQSSQQIAGGQKFRDICSKGQDVANDDGECGKKSITEHKLRKEKKEGTFGWLYPSNNWWTIEPDVGRVAHGISSRVDRLKCLGNTIVPQVVYEIIKIIADIENNASPL